MAEVKINEQDNKYMTKMPTNKLTCCFFGHRQLGDDENKLYKLLLQQIEPLIKTGFDEFLFGGYGAFDALAFRAVRQLKQLYPNIKAVYVHAYYNPKSEDSSLINKYDMTAYPAIEHAPKRFAITYRNRSMADCSQFCIAYVKRSYGGAYQHVFFLFATFSFSTRKKKK